MAGKTRAELLATTEALRSKWFHSIDLGQGVTTAGRKSAEQLAQELQALHLPDLNGKTVLDVGAWDGYFSFAAERLGAERVVALDHYVWSIDLEEQWRYKTECSRRGQRPRPWDEVQGVWRPDLLPGKACFDAAHDALESRVEPVVGDFMTIDPSSLGTFDVALFLGVLYHLRDPFGALQRLAAMTRQLAVIETAVIATPGYDRFALCQFIQGDELNEDPTNWWAPNARALQDLCLAAGFRRVEMNRQSPGGRVKRLIGAKHLAGYRGTMRAWK